MTDSLSSPAVLLSALQCFYIYCILSRQIGGQRILCILYSILFIVFCRWYGYNDPNTF